MPHRMHDGPAPDSHEDEQTALTADEYLTGERIVPHRLMPDMSVADLLDNSFQAYNAGRIIHSFPTRRSSDLDRKSVV